MALGLGNGCKQMYSFLSSEDLLGLIMIGKIDASRVSEEQLLDVELVAMDLVASKRAGGEHMVIWESGDLH